MDILKLVCQSVFLISFISFLYGNRYGEVLFDITNEYQGLPDNVVNSNLTLNLKEALMVANRIVQTYGEGVALGFEYYLRSTSPYFRCATLFELLGNFESVGICMGSSHSNSLHLFATLVVRKVNLCNKRKKIQNAKEVNSFNTLLEDIAKGVVVLYIASYDDESQCQDKIWKKDLESDVLRNEFDLEESPYEHVIILKITKAWLIKRVYRLRITFTNYKNKRGTTDILLNEQNKEIIWAEEGLAPFYYLVN